MERVLSGGGLSLNRCVKNMSRLILPGSGYDARPSGANLDSRALERCACE